MQSEREEAHIENFLSWNLEDSKYKSCGKKTCSMSLKSEEGASVNGSNKFKVSLLVNRMQCNHVVAISIQFASCGISMSSGT